VWRDVVGVAAVVALLLLAWWPESDRAPVPVARIRARHRDGSVVVAAASRSEVAQPLDDRASGSNGDVSDAPMISGRVVMAQDRSRGIEQAEVIGYRESGTGRASSITTDRDGNFELSGLARGTYRLMTIKRDMLSALAPPIELGDDDVTGLVIALDPGITLAGRVDPPAVADISLSTRDASVMGELTDNYNNVHGHSDATGGFTLRGVPRGALELGAITPDGSSGSITVDATSDRTGLVIELKPHASISGKVIDAHGAPVGFADVEPRREHDLEARGLPALRHDVLTQPDGTFRIVGLDAGRYGLVVRQQTDGFPAPGLTLDVEAGSEVRDLVITLPERTAQILGRVLAPDGSPAVGATVDVFGTSRTATTDATGVFTIDALRPDRYAIQVASADNTAIAAARVTTDKAVALTLTPAATLVMRVTDHGTPARDISVYCVGPPGHWRSCSTCRRAHVQRRAARRLALHGRSQRCRHRDQAGARRHRARRPRDLAVTAAGAAADDEACNNVDFGARS
jgi:hypothetical protein